MGWHGGHRGLRSLPTRGAADLVPRTIGKRGIRAAKSNDPASWLSFEEAKAAFTENPETFDGIMMALTAQDPYVFVDLDNAVDGKGHIKPWAKIGRAHV